MTRALGIAIVFALAGGGCAVEPASTAEESQELLGSGSNSCAIVDYGPPPCPEGQRCRQLAPAWVPPWRPTYLADDARFGPRCGALSDGTEIRCGAGEVCSGLPAAAPATMDSLDLETTLMSGSWCRPSDEVSGAWSITARHSNGAATTPARAPTVTSGSIGLPAARGGTSAGGAARAWAVPEHVGAAPGLPTGTWGPRGTLTCTVATHVRLRELGSWTSTACAAGGPGSSSCNPNGDVIWYVFADGVNSNPNRWPTGADAGIRPRVRSASGSWFGSNGFEHVERAVYVNNLGILDRDSPFVMRMTQAGPAGIPDATAVAGLEQVIAEARDCGVDYLSIVTHSNGVYTGHGALTAAYTSGDLNAQASSAPMTVSMHNLQAAIAGLQNQDGLINAQALDEMSGSSEKVEIELWWTSADYLTWFKPGYQAMVDVVNLFIPGKLASFGYNALPAWFNSIVMSAKSVEQIRLRSRTTDNCLQDGGPGLCPYNWHLVGPDHNGPMMLRYVAEHGYADWGPCYAGEDCYGFPHQTTGARGTYDPLLNPGGWISRYYPGASGVHGFKANYGGAVQQ